MPVNKLQYHHLLHGLGYRATFLAAAAGMIISMIIFWVFRKHVMAADRLPAWQRKHEEEQLKHQLLQTQTRTAMDEVPEWKRISALIIIFILVRVEGLSLVGSNNFNLFYTQYICSWFHLIC
ncbi:MAG: hypothetical protein HQK52_19790 [Oligoflexia bacterium]|nr:hypothetical protein [Oligoflexia bacterium]